MLIIDNYDSFTYNIVQYIKILGVEPIVIRNDELTLDEIKKLEFSKIILSPGWGNPENSGITMDVIDYYQDKLPILGVCLGMQCIAKYFGANIVKAPEPYHGKNSKIYFDENFELFKGMKQGFSATRYHSLVVDYSLCSLNQHLTPTLSSKERGRQNSIESPIKITAWTENKIPMAIKIKGKPIYGVQFHPEAILTEDGIEVFRNFIK